MRLNSLFTKAAVLSGIGALAFGVTPAQAAPYTINLTSSAGGTYVYTITLAQNESLVSGDFISIFDFGGYTTATSSLAGFNFQNIPVSPIARSGELPGLLTPPPVGSDDPGTLNVVANYTGGTLNAPAPFTFTITNPLAFGVRGDFSHGQTSDLTGSVQGKIATTTPVGVPLGVIPEPGTMTLLGMGALGALGMVRRRRSAK